MLNSRDSIRETYYGERIKILMMQFSSGNKKSGFATSLSIEVQVFLESTLTALRGLSRNAKVELS